MADAIRRCGRPPRMPGEPIVKVTIWMTEQEWQTIRQAARDRDQSGADYIRLASCGAAEDDREVQQAFRLGERRKASQPVASDRRRGERRR
jgi:uncharacterized protein (DUF1778 family)